MIDPFLAGLVISVATGLTVLAFQRPYIYAQLERPLHFVLFAVVMGIGLYGITVTYVHITLLPFIPVDLHAKAKAAVDEISISLKWYFFMWIVPGAYLTFLMWLAKKVAHDDARKDNKSAS